MKRWKLSIIVFSTVGFLAIGTSGFWLGRVYGRYSYAVEFSKQQAEIPVNVSGHQPQVQAPSDQGSIIRIHTEHGTVVMPGRADDWHQAEDAFALGEDISNFESHSTASSGAHDQELASVHR